MHRLKKKKKKGKKTLDRILLQETKPQRGERVIHSPLPALSNLRLSHCKMYTKQLPRFKFCSLTILSEDVSLKISAFLRAL